VFFRPFRYIMRGATKWFRTVREMALLPLAQISSARHRQIRFFQVIICSAQTVARVTVEKCLVIYKCALLHL
jgi:hypothetical protein